MKTQRVKPSEFASAVSSIIQQYSDDVIREMPDATKDAAKYCVKTLKAKADEQLGGEVYKRSFKSKKLKSTSTYTSYKIYSTQYRLTHLLEYGHFIVVHGKNLNRKTRAFPHWQPAEKAAIKELEENIKKKIMEAN